MLFCDLWRAVVLNADFVQLCGAFVRRQHVKLVSVFIDVKDRGHWIVHLVDDLVRSCNREALFYSLNASGVVKCHQAGGQRFWGAFKLGSGVDYACKRRYDSDGLRDKVVFLGVFLAMEPFICGEDADMLGAGVRRVQLVHHELVQLESHAGKLDTLRRLIAASLLLLELLIRTLIACVLTYVQHFAGAAELLIQLLSKHFIEIPINLMSVISVIPSRWDASG